MRWLLLAMVVLLLLLSVRLRRWFFLAGLLELGGKFLKGPQGLSWKSFGGLVASAFNKPVRVEVDRKGLLGLSAFREHDDSTKITRIKTYLDSFADKARSGLKDFPPQCDCAVLGHSPSCFLEKELVEIDILRWRPNAFGEPKPAVQGRFAAKRSMSPLVVLSLHPRPEQSIKLVDIVEAIDIQTGEETPPDRSKPAFDFRPSLRLVWSAVNELDAQPSG
jgi:hypothetical protein